MSSETFFSLRSVQAQIALLVPLALCIATPVLAQSLSGSKASMLRQGKQAHAHDYTYLRTSAQVNDFARRGLLVRLAGNSSYRVADVSFPYARPEVKTFVERLSSQYRGACGERLVVTSLTRPTTRQPRNASPLSVHPTGMAADLRISSRPACRAWIEKTLLVLEGQGVVEATKERHPPHYHVTLFPKPYMRYVAGRGGSADVKDVQMAKVSSESAVGKQYRVGRGDSLWSIAQRHKTSVTSLKRANGMRSTRLKPGQMLAIPAR
jgi:LysM repeat protein